MANAPETPPQKSVYRVAIGAWFGRLLVIGCVLLAVTASFLYAGGWFSPHRLTPAHVTDTFEGANGQHVGFRRNHSKGICIAGIFQSNGSGERLSKAAIFQKGLTPVVGRFALAGGQPYAADDGASPRSMALQFKLKDGEEWRTGMNNIPVFIVKTPEAFYEQLKASLPDPQTGKPNPDAMKTFMAAHPEMVEAIKAIKGHPFATGFDNDAYNSLDAFRFISAEGISTPVRWTMQPVKPYAPEELSTPGDKNYLFDDLIKSVATEPLQWHLIITVGKPEDATNDATIAWPEDREKIDVGTLSIDHVIGEDKGDCRDINFDPLVLPSGIASSDDPLLSARSAVYARSVTRRDGEAKQPSAVSTPPEASGATP